MKKTMWAIFLILFCLINVFSARLDVGSDKVVKVNNHIITLKELEKKYTELSKLPFLEGKELTKKEVLDLMIRDELFRNELKDIKNIILDENQLKAMIDQYKQAYFQTMLQDNPNFQYSDEKFQSYIENEGNITYEKFEETMKERVLARQYIVKKAEKDLQKIREKKYSKTDFPIAVPDARGTMVPFSSLEDFYDKNITQFVVGKSVETKHIMLYTLSQYNAQPLPESEKKIKKKKIDDVYSRLIKGESFDTLCELNSEHIESRDQVDPRTNKINRGYLGTIPKNDPNVLQMFGQAAVDALFSVGKGKYSAVIESNIGYHIFYVLDKKDQYIRSFAEVKPEIEEYFKAVEQNDVVTQTYNTIIDELKKKASIEYFKDEYKD